MKESSLIDRIFSNKVLFSGIGIFLVMLYHQPVDGVVSGLYFYPGFVGVDIFLFFSGYSLCYSYNKNSLRAFYKRRFVRVIPMLMVLGFLVSFNYVGYTFWDFICNMTSLYYYRLGGDVYEWYLAALLVFYIAFPLVYIICNIGMPNCNVSWMGGAILLLWVAIIGLAVVYDIPWYYQTAFGRLPIFILGVLCYKSTDNYKIGLGVFSIVLFIVVLLYIKGLISTYYLVYSIAPWVILLISFSLPAIKKSKVLDKMLSFMGEHSLEIYVANVLILVYTKSLFHGSFTTFIYWGLHIVLIPVFCLLNGYIKKLKVA